ncbi:hypothetical protein BC936DRAFT_136842 [Jimgerdemannia flammicorona]|uniref:Amino acid permease-domain-containing protein n=1 Tax=Jimgerdemannia flammicorona TaxID=994334 RepID=A0A433CYP6_9FUNG|nr:hypothetical protein BC936DRAFT_136842 [Jimgerdemannia flammicorona]
MVLPSQTSSGSNDQNHQLPVTRPVNTIASTYLQQHEQRYSPHGSSSEAAALTAITGTAEKRRSEDIVDHNAEPKFAESIAEIHTVDITDYKVKSNPSTTTTRHRSRVHSLANVAPPSFAESQFQTIQRRQAGVTLKYSSSPSRYPNLSNAWEFAGWGSTYYMEISPSAEAHDVPQLDQFRATAIAGNDLIASVLYTLGGTIVLAGKYAPISLFIVTIVIYPFKDIITEVGTALPLNGGTYNCMLNTTSKLFAAVAAALSILSYVATAVVSAATATAYLAGEVTLPTHLSVFWLTILVMVLFASVTLLGIKESSNLAFGIFTLHCCVLLVLMIMSVIHWRTIGSAILAANWYDTTYSATSPSAAALQIFNGFCIGLLGITGFESAENYIEDQKPGVFPKVMRNMWGLVFFFNAPIALLATAVVPMSVLMVSSANVLSVMAEYAGGKWLRWLIVADAVIVLCAGVLTGFIGVGGLIEKMAVRIILIFGYFIDDDFP